MTHEELYAALVRWAESILAAPLSARPSPDEVQKHILATDLITRPDYWAWAVKTVAPAEEWDKTIATFAARVAEADVSRWNAEHKEEL
jgi:hypothetical protein